jgi:hypothetical protein
MDKTLSESGRDGGAVLISVFMAAALSGGWHRQPDYPPKPNIVLGGYL